MKHFASLRVGCAGLFCSLSILLFTGCASSPSSGDSGGSGGSGGSNIPDAASLTGNWQATLQPAANTPPLTAFAGYINQIGSKTAQGQFTTSVFQISGDCFVPSPLVPLQGNNKAGAVSLDSYGVNSQMFHLTGTSDATGASMSGSYAVDGGCASGASGTFSAVRYAPLTGKYSGTLSTGAAAGSTVSVNLTEAPGGTGSGTFLLTGDLSLTGTGCTLNGTAAPSEENFVQGSHVQISFPVAGSSGSTAVLSGTSDPTGATISNVTVSVTGGSCAGLQETGTLKH